MSMKIYTKTGDEGETGLFGGPRVGKDSPRIEAYGTVDELNAILGQARTEALSSGNAACDVAQILKRVQDELFVLGADLASPVSSKHETPRITPSMVSRLEIEIDALDATLDPLKDFILPGGTASAALLHFARTVCRRAERRTVALARRGRRERGRSVLPQSAERSPVCHGAVSQRSSWTSRREVAKARVSAALS